MVITVIFRVCVSLVGFVICVVAAADAKQRLGEFASREVPEHEIKVAREMHYLGIDWPPNGFVCMELIRAVAWAVSIYLLILEYETHSTIETLLYTWWSCVRSLHAVLKFNLSSGSR